MNKKITMSVVALLLCLALTACADSMRGSTSSSKENTNSSTTEKGSINIGVFDMGTLYLMQTFDDMGYFKDNGANIKFTYFPVYSDAISAFNTGNVDMICYAASEAVAPVVNGVDCRIIGVFDTSNGLDGIAAGKGISSIKDLKGKTIATEIGSVDHMMLQQALKKNDMTAEDVNIVNMSAGDSVAALASGSIQAVSTWEPQLSMAAQYGSVIYSTKEDPNLIADVFLIHTDVLNSQYENAKAFVKTWYEYAADYSADPNKYAEKAAAKGNISSDDFKAIMSVTHLMNLDDNKAAFTKGTGDNKYLNVLLRTVGDFLYDGKLVSGKITDDQINKLLDPRIINDLINGK
jgi:NitT/TauT family transport system substrate-binding protein